MIKTLESETDASFASRNGFDTPNQVVNMLYRPFPLRGSLLFRHEEPVMQKKENILEEVRYALELKARCYEALGVKMPEASSGYLAFEPWLERARYERSVTDPILTPQERQERAAQFKQEATVQMLTNLRERNRAEQSTVNFVIIDGKMRCALLPDENFEDILERGLQYRENSGSNELVRENAEVKAFTQYVQPAFCALDAKVGSRVIVCSPPSDQQNTSYVKRFIDIWELKQDEEGKQWIELTRFTTGLDYEGYKKGLLKLNPAYFEGFAASGMSFATYLLSHPITLPAEEQIGPTEALYEAFFERDNKTMRENAFQAGIPVFMPFISYCIEELCKERIDWRAFARGFNATLNVSDEFFEKNQKQADKDFLKPQSNPKTIYFNQFDDINIYKIQDSKTNPALPIEAQVAYYNSLKAATKMLDCGKSGTLEINDLFSNSIGVFGAFSSSNNINILSNGGAEFKVGCKDCGKSTADNHYHCPKPKCKNRFSDETNIKPEYRTKNCKCGFKFGC